MVNVSVKAPDIGFQAADAGKGRNSTKGTSSDQFRKLLQGKQDSSREDNKSQEVSGDVKQDKTEAPKDTKETKENTKEGSKSEAGEDTARTEDNSQAQEMLAAYQMSQGMRPELLQAEPEVVIEVPELSQAGTEVQAVDVTEAVEVVPQMEVVEDTEPRQVFRMQDLRSRLRQRAAFRQR